MVNITKITVTPGTATVDVGDTQQFTAVAWAGAIPHPTEPVRWASSSLAVGTIDSNGKFTAASPGTTVITAMHDASSKSATSDVTVRQQSQSSQKPRRVNLSPNVTAQQPSWRSSEWKETIALLLFLAYILISYYLTGFNLGSFFIFLTGAASFLSVDLENLRTKWHKFAMFILWIALLIIGFLSSFPKEIYFLMLVAALAGAMDSFRTGGLFFAVSALCLFTFEASVIGFIVTIVVFLFIYAASESLLFGVVMMVPLLAVGWFIGSGWGDMVEQRVSSISTQVSVSTGVSTEGIGSGLSSALNNTWLLLTDPNAWYEKQYVMSGAERDQGLTSAALEVTKIEALPTSVLPFDTFDVVFELENKGTKEAVGVTVGAKGDTFADACGRFSGLYCNPKCVDLTANPGTELTSCVVNKTLNTIAPMERGFDTFTFQAPECPGTYKVGAAVKYNYSVETTMNLQMISRDYYTDLLRNNKMKWSDEISLTSAGPFKMSLRTSPIQPIPDKLDSTPQIFRVYLGLVNEKPGTATMHSAIIKLPKDIELVGWEYSGNTPGSKMDDSCSITYDVKRTEGTAPNQVTGYLSDMVAKAVKEKMKISQADYEAMEKRYYEDASKIAADAGSEYITYRTVDPDPARKFSQNEWRYYKCSFRRVADAPKIDQIQTYFMRAELPYTFEYEKYATVSVRSVTGAIPPQCRKELKQISAISTSQTKPQTKDAILKELAKEIYYCYNKNQGFIDSTSDCGNFKIDIEGCGAGMISALDIKSALESVPQYKVAVDDSSVNILAQKRDASGSLIDIRTDAGKEVYNDKNIYTIKIQYVSAYFTNPLLFSFGPIGMGIAALLNKNTLMIAEQSVAADSACPTADTTPASCQTDATCGSGLSCLRDPNFMAGQNCQCVAHSSQTNWVACQGGAGSPVLAP